MKTRMLVILMAGAVLVARGQNPDLDQMQNMLKAMQQTITNLQAEIQELKRNQAKGAALAAQANTTNGAGVEFIIPTIKKPPGISQIIPHESMRDYQEAAPRPGDLTLDPKYRGFFPIPNTPAFVKFNAKVKLDIMGDNQNSGNPDRFVTAQIPVESESRHGGGSQFNLSARGSSLSVDVRAPDLAGDPRLYYNNDFFGGGTGGGMGYRLKHLYGQYFNVTAGFTYSIFEDPDVWPDTIDFEGPNSMIFARQPTLRYLLALNDHWQISFGIQQPASEIDNVNVPDASSVNHAPDGGFNIRWEDSKAGHVQFGTIFRDVGARSDTLGDDSVFGWGLMLSAGMNVFKKDTLQAQVTYGEGYFHYANDNFTYSGFNGGDAAFDSSGDLQALPLFSAMLGYTHHWTDKFRSTASAGYVNLDNESSQGPLAYHETFYSSLNLVYEIRKRLNVGIEGLYGWKEVKNGDSGDVFRVQVGLSFALFD